MCQAREEALQDASSLNAGSCPVDFSLTVISYGTQQVSWKSWMLAGPAGQLMSYAS